MLTPVTQIQPLKGNNMPTKSNRPSEPHGPQYNIDSATLKKFRSTFREGLSSLSRDERQAYGAAVETAVRAAQRSALRRAGCAIPNPNCASGTAHNTGEAIHEAIRERQRNAILAGPSKIRRARKPHEWQAMYEAAMAEKRAINLNNRGS
jgi:hypothetical protein